MTDENGTQYNQADASSTGVTGENGAQQSAGQQQYAQQPYAQQSPDQQSSYAQQPYSTQQSYDQQYTQQSAPQQPYAQQSYGQQQSYGTQQQYSQQPYAQQQPQQPYAQPYGAPYQYAPVETSPTVSMGNWVLSLLLTFIPVVGLVMIIVWSFDGSTPASKKNWARAMLIWQCVAIALTVLACVLFAGALSSWSHDMSSQFSTMDTGMINAMFRL